MNIVKGVISSEEARKLAPKYVDYCENGPALSSELFEPMFAAFNKLKKGQKALTFIDGKYVLVRVTQVNFNTPLAIDGPVVRVSNSEYSWRCDGDGYASPIN